MKNDEKSLLEGSWRALGRSWGPRWPVEAQKGRDAFPPCNINRLLERSWGGLGALLGSSWVVLGGLWGVSGAIFLALGRSWVHFGGTLVTMGFSDSFLSMFLHFFLVFFGYPFLYFSFLCLPFFGTKSRPNTTENQHKTGNNKESQHQQNTLKIDIKLIFS